VTDGFGGAGAEVTFDRNTKTARVRAYSHQDFGPPFELFWSDVHGQVKIRSWDLFPNTLIDVDLRGMLDGQEQSLGVCTLLDDGRRF
jgi:hypothetical protein